MKNILKLVLLGLSLLACRSECDEAIDRWEECVGTDSTGISIEGEECSAKSECVARCINDADCIELQNYADPDGVYHQCSSKC